MKKIKLLTASITILGVIFLTSCNGGKTEARKAFIDNCNLSAQQQAGAMGEKFQEAFVEYCECSAKILIDNKSSSEIINYDELAKSNDPSKMQAMMEEIKPCLEALQAKATAVDTE